LGGLGNQGLGNIINQGFGGQGSQGFGGQGNQGFGGLNIIPNHNYKIVSALNPSFALDSSGDPQFFNHLITYQFHGGLNQLWRFVPDNNGTYSIINAGTGNAIEIPNHGNFVQGVQGQAVRHNNGINEKWRIVPAQGQGVGKGHVIQSAFNNFVLDIGGGIVQDCAKVIIWQGNNQLNQTWVITAA
jgi:hypothetical protein